MTHSFHGGGNHCKGFTVIETTIGTSDSSARDAAYVVEHEHLQYLRKKIGNYLHDFHRPWFRSFGLPPSNGKHDQLFGSDIRRLMGRVQNITRDDNRSGPGRKRPGINVFARLDIGHKDFFGKQFVNCRPLRSHHKDVRMDYVFFIPPPPFYEGTRAEFDVTLESCWYGRVVLLFRILVKTDQKDRNGRSVLKECDCAMIDCLYDYAKGR
jgi:hypothetical protein